jgi:hypothetical protein
MRLPKGRDGTRPVEKLPYGGTDSALLRRWMYRGHEVLVNLLASRALACIDSVINSSHVQLEGRGLAQCGGKGSVGDNICADPTA